MILEDISTQTVAESRGAKSLPVAPCKWKFRRISARRVESHMDIAPSPQSRPTGGSANSPVLQDLLMILLHDRPQNREVRNPSISPQVSGDCAELRKARRNFHGPRPFAAEPDGHRIRESPTFSRGARRYFYANARRIPRCEIPPPSSQVSGDFAKSRQVERHSPESRPIGAEPDGGSAHIRCFSVYRGDYISGRQVFRFSRNRGTFPEIGKTPPVHA